jgi:hypothetical protein
MAGDKIGFAKLSVLGEFIPLQQFLTSIIVQRFRLSVEQLAAVDDERVAGDEGSFVGNEK